MEESTLNLNEKQYYELIAFIVTSAFLMYQGEQYEELYPSIRLMDIASRLTKNLIENDNFEGENWPHNFVENLDHSFSSLETDKQGFVDFIQNTMVELVSKTRAYNE